MRTENPFLLSTMLIAGEELRSKSPRVVKKVTPVLNPGGAIYDLAMFGTETRLAELVGS